MPGLNDNQPSDYREFSRLFVMHSSALHFLQHSKKVVGIDNCHIKTFFHGSQCDIATLDANSQLYILAYARMGAETKDNMEWVVKSFVASSPVQLRALITDNGTSFLSMKNTCTQFPILDCGVHASWNAWRNKSEEATKYGVAWCKASSIKALEKAEADIEELFPGPTLTYLREHGKRLQYMEILKTNPDLCLFDMHTSNVAEIAHEGNKQHYTSLY